MDILLKKLVDCFSVSGHEDTIREIIKKEINGMNAEIKEDKMGNLIVSLGQGTEKLMLCSHMDNSGFIVTYIEDNGFARVGKIGDFEIKSLVHSFVKFENGTVGKVGSAKSDPKDEDLFIDLGVSSREEALKLVKEGDTAICMGYQLERNDNIISPNLNNAVGCYTLIRLIKEVSKFNRQTYFVFSAQKQLGGRGARAAAYAIEPNCCIVLHHEEAGDTIGGEGNIKIGEGPVVTVMDRSLIIHHEIKEMLQKASEEAEIKLQYSIGKGSTDGGNIHKEASGVKTGVLSIPMRYVNTPSEMISMSDVESRIKILKALL